MGYYGEPLDWNDAYNHRDLSCPRCGANAVTVLRYPQKRSWMNGNGRAGCDHCGLVFAITLVEVDSEGNEIPSWQSGQNQNGRKR